jgi:hypothetical protein
MLHVDKEVMSCIHGEMNPHHAHMQYSMKERILQRSLFYLDVMKIEHGQSVQRSRGIHLKVYVIWLEMYGSGFKMNGIVIIMVHPAMGVGGVRIHIVHQPHLKGLPVSVEEGVDPIGRLLLTMSLERPLVPWVILYLRMRSPEVD